MIQTRSDFNLPAQMLPLSKKNDAWKEACMDAFENIGRQQFFNNMKLIENYEMVKGKFIYSHYIDKEEYTDMITHLTKEFDIPSHLRHYDIISQVINTLSGEYQKRPDSFRVEAKDEKAQNNFLREKTDLLQKYVNFEFESRLNQKLLEEGLDPTKDDFISEEEAAKYNEQLQARTKELTPEEIETYMQTSWMDQAEIWGQHQIELDKQRFNLPEMEKIEFEDMLIADRCFRHYYLTPNGYSQETWNPINTFYHKSPEVRYVERGDFVGRTFFLTNSEIINRYGHKMTEEEITSLESGLDDDYSKSSGYISPTNKGWTANKTVPHANYIEQKQVENLLGYDPLNPNAVDTQISIALGENDLPINSSTLTQVTEVYWMSQRKIGKYVYRDIESGEILTILVDEDFKIKGIKELTSGTFEESVVGDEVNTITWTWVNQVWNGVKIGANKQNSESKPMYIDVGPAKFQFKGDNNIYGAKLPVCGQIFNNRNSESMSLVDLMKPHQIGHNVSMNQLYEIQQREIGRFLLADMNFMPAGKDWGGEKAFEKVMLVARQLGIAPMDGSPGNTKGSSFAHFQMIDLDESARMISRAKMAEFYEQRALAQVGITPQRLGSVAASETATGVQQAVNQSYAQTESYFTNFSNYKRRCLTMDLEIAQYVQSKEDDIIVSYVNSDASRAFIKIAGIDLLLSELGVYISNSQELLRQLETLRRLFIENNTTQASALDLATVVTSNSPAQIKVQLEKTYKQQQAQKQAEMQQLQQIEDNKIAAMQEAQAKQLTLDNEHFEKKLANDRYIAEVKGMGFAKNTDTNSNGIPDLLEIQRFNAELGKTSEDILFNKQKENNRQTEAQQKLKIEQDKLKQAKELADKQDVIANKQMELERDKMQNDKEIASIKKKSTS